MDKVIDKAKTFKSFVETFAFKDKDESTTIKEIKELFLKEKRKMSELEVLKYFPGVCELGLYSMQTLIMMALERLCEDGFLIKTVDDGYNYYRLKN